MCNGHFSEGKNETQRHCIKADKSKAIISTNDFQCYYIKRSPTIYVGKEVEFTNKDIVTKKSVLIKPALSVAVLYCW